MGAFRCPYCGNEFDQQTVAVKHIRACRSTKQRDKPEEPDPKTEWKPSKEDARFLRSLRIAADA